jgi:hypothetical protein
MDLKSVSLLRESQPRIGAFFALIVSASRLLARTFAVAVHQLRLPSFITLYKSTTQ